MEKFAAKYHFARQFTADLIAINDIDLSSLVLLQRISGRYKHQPLIAFNFNLFWYVHFCLLSITEPFIFSIVSPGADMAVDFEKRHLTNCALYLQVAERLVSFFKKFKSDPSHWGIVSAEGFKCIYE
ncbi:hypothetical protein MKW92_025376, partial [Papaver armeniacum]